MPLVLRSVRAVFTVLSNTKNSSIVVKRCSLVEINCIFVIILVMYNFLITKTENIGHFSLTFVVNFCQFSLFV